MSVVRIWEKIDRVITASHCNTCNIDSSCEAVFILTLGWWLFKLASISINDMFLLSRPVVVLSGYKRIKDALVTHGQQFAGRPAVNSKDKLRFYTPNFPILGRTMYISGA